MNVGADIAMPCRAALSALTIFACATDHVCLADEFRIPVPRAIIYPGATIADDMLTDTAASAPIATGTIVSRSEILGQVARRTLLPGVPIQRVAVDEPARIRSGARVKIVFQSQGVTIESSAIAMQAGRVGDFVQLRSSETSRIVAGTIMADGTVGVEAP